MEPTLRGVNLKLYRAYEHHRTLRDESPSIIDGNRVLHRLVPQAHPDGRGYNFDLPWLQPLDAGRWSVILGDFLSNLRSALDQTVYQLHVIAYDGEVPEKIERVSAFPIRRELPRAKRGVVIPTDKWREIRNLPDEQRALIEGLQPYKGGDDDNASRRGALLLLDTLNNIDKHRRLHVVRHVVSSTTVPLFPARYGLVRKPRFPDAAESGAKVDEWRTKFTFPADLTYEVNMHAVALEEVLSEPGIRQPVFEMTRSLHNHVVSVIRKFVPFFRRAGITGLKLPDRIPKEYLPAHLAKIPPSERWW